MVKQIFHYLAVSRQSKQRVCVARLRFISGNTPPFEEISLQCEPLATLCLIWPARDLNVRTLAPEKNALPLDQLLVGTKN